MIVDLLIDTATSCDRNLDAANQDHELLREIAKGSLDHLEASHRVVLEDALLLLEDALLLVRLAELSPNISEDLERQVGRLVGHP